MPFEHAVWAMKPLFINFGMAFLASLVRYYLIPHEERELKDIPTFLVLAVFVSQIVTWLIGSLQLEADTKYAAAAISALLANEIIRGLLRVAIKVFPQIEKKLSERISRMKI